MQEVRQGVPVFAAAYDLIARVFIEGPAALAPGVRPPIEELLAALLQLDPQVADEAAVLLAADPAAHAREFEEALRLPLPGRAVPACASVYLDGGTLYGRTSLKVMELYEREGLAVGGRAPGGQPLPPDHAGCEAAFLALLESGGDARGDEQRAQRLRREFLANHILRWVPQFAESLRQRGHLWLAGFAQLFAHLAQLDLARVEEVLQASPSPERKD